MHTKKLKWNYDSSVVHLSLNHNRTKNILTKKLSIPPHSLIEQGKENEI